MDPGDDFLLVGFIACLFRQVVLEQEASRPLMVPLEFTSYGIYHVYARGWLPYRLDMAEYIADRVDTDTFNIGYWHADDGPIPSN